MTSTKRIIVDDDLKAESVELKSDQLNSETMTLSVVSAENKIAAAEGSVCEQTGNAHSTNLQMPQGIRSRWQNQTDSLVDKSVLLGANSDAGSFSPSPQSVKTPHAHRRWKSIVTASLCIVFLPFLVFAKDLIMMTIGTAAIHYGNVPIAATIANFNFRNNPTCAGFLVGWGNMVAAKDPASAIEFYNDAISASSRHASAYLNRGRNFVKLKRYDEAMADFNLALALNPRSPAALYERGALYDLKNKGH